MQSVYVCCLFKTPYMVVRLVFELKKATFLHLRRKPEVNISHTRTECVADFPSNRLYR